MYTKVHVFTQYVKFLSSNCFTFSNFERMQLNTLTFKFDLQISIKPKWPNNGKDKQETPNEGFIYGLPI